MSGANHVGRANTIHALGTEWTVGRWTRGVWAALLEWAKPRIPDPLDVGKKAMAIFPEAHHAAIVRHAVDAAEMYIGIDSPHVGRCLDDILGTAQILYQLLKPAHPNVTEDEAFDVMVSAGPKAVKDALAISSGKTPPAAEGKGSAPAA